MEINYLACCSTKKSSMEVAFSIALFLSSLAPSSFLDPFSRVLYSTYQEERKEGRLAHSAQKEEILHPEMLWE